MLVSNAASIRSIDFCFSEVQQYSMMVDST